MLPTACCSSHLKKAAANANHTGGRLDPERYRLIVQTCDQILVGKALALYIADCTHHILLLCLSSISWHNCAGASLWIDRVESAIFASNPTMYVTNLRRRGLVSCAMSCSEWSGLVSGCCPVPRSLRRQAHVNENSQMISDERVEIRRAREILVVGCVRRFGEPRN